MLEGIPVKFAILFFEIINESLESGQVWFIDYFLNIQLFNLYISVLQSHSVLGKAGVLEVFYLGGVAELRFAFKEK